jgi:hypothetical protein
VGGAAYEVLGSLTWHAEHAKPGPQPAHSRQNCAGPAAPTPRRCGRSAWPKSCGNGRPMSWIKFDLALEVFAGLLFAAMLSLSAWLMVSCWPWWRS